ncbi:MAG TPA: hypothetical protein VLR93_05720 [Patescibacteria group bacterium]|nr:hypothetical protein [Patescibacteria group bacterium]
MKNANVIPFSPPDGAAPDGVHGPADGSPVSDGTRVVVDAERIVVERLVLVDAGLAGFIAERSPADRASLLERALRIGLVALQDAGVTVNVDAVRREFDGLLARTALANDKAAGALDQLLRQNFADGDGRLPRTLETFLGDRGRLQAFVAELFDETKRDSAIGKMRTLLGTYFDGDASRLAQLLDPTRMHSPLHQFRVEVTDGFTRLNDRLTAIEAAATARASERSRSAAKGADFEDLLEAMLGDIARGSGDLVDRTGTEAGDVIRSKKGDFVLTIDPARTAGAELRIVIEAKDRAMSGRQMRDEIREAKTNRGAAVGLVVFTPNHAPSGIAPFDVRAGDVYCVVDPEAPDPGMLEAAVRLARLLAQVSLRDQAIEVDATAIKTALDGVREQLELIKGLKSTLTSIGTSSRDVAAGLDRLRDGVIARIGEAEAELRRAS